MILVNEFNDILKKTVKKILQRNNLYIIPHGTLISSFELEAIENLKVPLFGNKHILKWEADRKLKQRLMEEAKLTTPKEIKNKKMIKSLSIVKLHGAAGGKGYFLAWDEKSFNARCKKLIRKGIIESEDDLYIQEYILGVPVYLQFFHSPIKNDVELLGIDRRYESDIDGIGRIPATIQHNINLEPTYNVIGNSPLVLRESLLQKAFLMAERFVAATKRLVKPGIPGTFCLEGVYDCEGNFITFEFSARIVAGTNLFIDGSSYSSFLFDVPMSMGRRIARELKIGIKENRISELVT
jgi:5-formaminoimidazole-4-carboxamide-1-(beta)-D-ribofuranosyl 5'-monophosphate synthetase